MNGSPSIEARGGLKIHMESLGEPYDVVDAIMKNDAIIHKAAHIRRALGNRRSIPTCIKWADQWVRENKKENEENTSNNDGQADTEGRNDGTENIANNVGETA